MVFAWKNCVDYKKFKQSSDGEKHCGKVHLSLCE
jgi:hypothetical protein